MRRSLSKIYNQDTTLVPSYYSRPGPGLYNDFTAGAGEKTQVSKYKNAPKCSIQKPRDWQLVRDRFKRSISRESLRSATPVRDTVISLKKLEKTPKPDTSWTRFYNLSADL